jgi:hypothetical protein
MKRIYLKLYSVYSGNSIASNEGRVTSGDMTWFRCENYFGAQESR